MPPALVVEVRDCDGSAAIADEVVEVVTVNVPAAVNGLVEAEEATTAL